MNRVNLGDAILDAREKEKWEKCRARFRRYYYRHPDRIKARNVRYYEKNMETIRMRNHEFYRTSRAHARIMIQARLEAFA